MVKARTLDKRRKAVRNIRKITRTMELIATARFRRAADRALAAGAYLKQMNTLVEHLQEAGFSGKHPLLEKREPVQRVVLLILTANRGLCGGFNSNILRVGVRRLEQLRGECEKVVLHVAGRRGVSALKFRGIHAEDSFNHLVERPRWQDVDQLAKRYLTGYLAGEVDRVEVAYTKLTSLSRQEAVVETILPLTLQEHKEVQETRQIQYDFLPSVDEIMEELLPFMVRTRLFKCFLDSAASEQIARMVAMKAATENADTMLKQLTMTYNRARQTQITSEILEVITAADALTK